MNFNKRLMFRLVLVLLTLVFVISGCSADVEKSNFGENNNEEFEGYFDDSRNIGETALTSYASTDRKIIFTSNMNIETTEYEKSINALEELISDYDGFIQDSKVEKQTSVNTSNTTRRATYTIRIPTENRDEFVSQAGNVGVIIVNETKGEDVTEKYIDSTTRKNTLEVQETRLLELLEEAESLEDVLDIEERLATIRYDIETLTGTLNQLSSLVQLSTYYIEIQEVKSLSEPDPETFIDQVSSTFNSSINALVNTLRYISLGVVAILPFILTLGLFILIVVIIVKIGMRKKRNKDS